jgi:hypothetical protein
MITILELVIILLIVFAYKLISKNKKIISILISLIGLVLTIVRVFVILKIPDHEFDELWFNNVSWIGNFSKNQLYIESGVFCVILLTFLIGQLVLIFKKN